jgi:hypothetical protein
MALPPKTSAKTSAKSSPPAAGKPPPKAPKAAPTSAHKSNGPPISAAFHAPGAIAPASADMGPSAPPTPVNQPADPNSAYQRLAGRAIAQALLGQFAQAIAQPK